MAWYWWVLLVIVTIYVYSRRSGRAGEIDSRDASLLNPWFQDQGIEPSSVHYSSYSDRNILGPGADKLYVGLGDKEGQSVGFWVEMAGAEIADSKTIHPGAASYHRTDARAASFEASLLKHKLTERSLRLHANI